ncbi:hypothetical protein JYU34_019985 [Plutella xylostella]|uniref:C2H2-type domain-containing protein n=1 Tax=Plutella xylostella TaxID=51655 RepID=A0ABQ7PVN8_PLUXY|nr:hypothetical protein JYU34_019985 [Plutella xylostella]
MSSEINKICPPNDCIEESFADNIGIKLEEGHEQDLEVHSTFHVKSEEPEYSLHNDPFNENIISEPSNSYINDSAAQKDNVLKTLVENIQLEIKQEFEASHEDEAISHEINDTVNVTNKEDELEIKEEFVPELDLEVSNKKIDNNSALIENSDDANNVNAVKLEPSNDGNSFVSYDFPQFDSASVDSSDASFLGHLDNSLLEEIKSENVDFEQLHQDKEYENCNIKTETDLTVTETHLISNKLINTTSTITHPQHGIIESQTTRTLVMEILPMTMYDGKISGGNPEEILPTTNEPSCEEDSFQLNSITGDAPPLTEYGLLNSASTAKLKEEKVVYCPKCPKVCKNIVALRRHLKIHDSIDRYKAGRERGRANRREKKNKPTWAWVDETQDTQDSDEDKATYTCTCGNKFTRHSRMKTCLNSHDEGEGTVTFPCTACAQKFKTKDRLEAHRKSVHRKRKFPCKFCPTDYDTRKELFKHLRKHQKVQLMEFKIMSEIVESKQKLKCIMCNKSFDELSELKSHVMGDHKAPFKCTYCKESFSKIDDLATHCKTAHPDVKGQSVLDALEAFSKLAQAWKCEECNLQFNKAEDLGLHQVENHRTEVKVKTEIEQFQCVDCRRVFCSNKSLNSHRRVHHNVESTEDAPVEPEGTLCVHCRKICKDEYALTSHMRFHSSERKYPCKFCDFRFATVEKRKTHAEIHTGSMRYVCFICEYRCSSENRLKNHKASAKHLSMKDYLLTGKPLENLTAKEEKIADALRANERDVKKRRMSEEEPSHSSSGQTTCDVCGEKFSSEKKMLDHKQTHPFIEFPNEDQPSRIFFK